MQKLDKIKDVKVAEQSIEVDPRSKTTADQAFNYIGTGKPEMPVGGQKRMLPEKKITSQFDNDPLLKLKSREVDLRAMENERKKDNDKAQIDIAKARLMQQGDIAEDKMEQNEDLAKLRAGVSLAKSGVDQAKVMIED